MANNNLFFNLEVTPAGKVSAWIKFPDGWPAVPVPLSMDEERAVVEALQAAMAAAIERRANDGR